MTSKVGKHAEQYLLLGERKRRKSLQTPKTWRERKKSEKVFWTHCQINHGSCASCFRFGFFKLNDKQWRQTLEKSLTELNHGGMESKKGSISLNFMGFGEIK